MTIKIYNNDCLVQLPKIKEKVDLVVVDLPYAQTACKWDSLIDMKQMWVELKKICKRDCVYVFFCTTKFGYKLIQSNEKWFRYDLIWEKSRKVGFLNANKMPLRKHEMMYVFADDNNDDLENNRNLGLRAYFGAVKNYIGKTLKGITKDCGRCAEHCFYINSTQFGLPTEKTYNLLIEKYDLQKMPGFRDYKSLKDGWDKPKPNKTYNSQKTKGKPYKTKKQNRDTGIYGEVKGISTTNKGTRHPSSIVAFPEAPEGKPERKHEMMYVFKEKQGTYNPQKTKGKPYTLNKIKPKEKELYGGQLGINHKRENKGTRHPSTIVAFNNPKKSIHRTQKPVDLCEWLIKSYSNSGDLVLDFTMGSGTTGVACLNTGRRFIGIEKDKAIFKTAKHRIFKHELQAK